MALIEIDHVSKTYGTRDGGVVANDDVTLHVEEGSVFGLFGHNGAGKTSGCSGTTGPARRRW